MGGFSLTYVAIVSAIALKLGLLFNGQVLNGLLLTILGVGVGLLLALAVLAYANYASKRDMLIIPSEGHVVHWYTKPFFASNMAAVTLIVAVAAVSATNNMFHYQGSWEAQYTVTDTGVAFFGASTSKTATLSNESSSFQVLVSREESVEIGEVFTAEVKRGLLGFEHVVSYAKSKS